MSSKVTLYSVVKDGISNSCYFEVLVIKPVIPTRMWLQYWDSCVNLTVYVLHRTNHYYQQGVIAEKENKTQIDYFFTNLDLLVMR